MKQIYDIVYNDKVAEKTAEKIDTAVFINQKGGVVEEYKRLSKKVGMKLTHPEQCLVFDEDGRNTSMKKDGHIAEAKHILHHIIQETQAQ